MFDGMQRCHAFSLGFMASTKTHHPIMDDGFQYKNIPYKIVGTWVQSLLELGTTCMHDLEINTHNIQHSSLLRRIYMYCVARKCPQIHTQVINKYNLYIPIIRIRRQSQMTKILLARHIYLSLMNLLHNCSSIGCNSTNLFPQYKSLQPMQSWFLTLPSYNLSNRRSTLTHSYFDTNITLFPLYRNIVRFQRSITCQYSVHMLLIFWCILQTLPKYQVLVVNVLAYIFQWLLERQTIPHGHISISMTNHYPGSNSRTLGLTNNIPNLILADLSLDNVGLPFNSITY